MDYQEPETYVMFGVEYRATRDQSNDLSARVMDTAEARRYSVLGELMGLVSRGGVELSRDEALALCEERVDLEIRLGEIVRQGVEEL